MMDKFNTTRFVILIIALKRFEAAQFSLTTTPKNDEKWYEDGIIYHNNFICFNA